jgi:hypothetical protein
MTEIFERLVRSSHDASVRLKVRSTLNPMLWLCGIVCPVCFGFSLALDGALRVVLVALGGLPIVVACASYVLLMFRRPDDLKSEEFQLRKMALELIEEKGGRIQIESVSVNEITNPDLPQLPDADSEDGR